MDTGDADRRAEPGAVRLGFGRYVLDLGRGSLLLGGNEVPLRPKTFAVLKFLVENAGSLVSKEQLFAAVWPNLVVTDDALVQSIGELRRALGDDGPRLIKTVPRRGYRFETATVLSPVVPDVHDEGSAPATGPIGAPSQQAGAGTVLPDVTGSAADVAQPQARHFGARSWRLRMADGANEALDKSSGAKGPIAVTIATLAAVLLSGALWVGLPSLMSDPLGRPSSGNPAKDVRLNTRPGLAILPFEDQSDDPSRGYLADGLTQDIIGAMGRFSALTVISWNAVAPYRGKFAVPAQIARDLGVRYQVEGTVQRGADRIRVTARLVGSGGEVLWSSRFDEAASGLFVLQEKITDQIAGALAIHVNRFEQQRAFAKPTASLEAYDYVLRARPALQRPDRAAIVEARSLLKRAIELDPNYAVAYAALAETYHIDVSWGWAQSPAEVLGRSEALVVKSLQLDDDGVLAHIVLGRIHVFHHRFEQAKAEMDRAIEINSSDADGLAGRGNIQMWLGQTDAAIASLEMAQRIDPALNAVDRFALSMTYYLKGRYGEAGRQAEINLRNSASSSFSYVVLAAAYAQQGRMDEAAGLVATIRRIDPTFDANDFGSKFRSSADRESLQEGLRKAGLDVDAVIKPPDGK